MSDLDLSVKPMRATEKWEVKKKDSEEIVSIKIDRKPRNKIDKFFFSIFNL